MKKILNFFLIFIFSNLFCVAQNLTDTQIEYQCKKNYDDGLGYFTDSEYEKNILSLKKIDEIKKYESQNLWIHALGSYYDLIDEDSTLNSVEIFNRFDLIAETIKSGKPGLAQYNNSELQKAWQNLQMEFEQYFLEKSCVYVDIQKNNSVMIKASISNKYKILYDIVKTGFNKAYTKLWLGFNPKWLEMDSENFVCYYVDFEKIINCENYIFEFILTDFEGDNIFGKETFVAKNNEVKKMNNVNFSNTNVKITKWGYNGRYVNYIPLDLSQIKFSNDDCVSKIKSEIEKMNNASLGYGRILDQDVKAERIENKKNSLGEITNKEAINQQLKNQKNGLGKITDFQVEQEKKLNKKYGRGEISNAQADLQRQLNKRLGMGEITDKQFETIVSISDCLKMIPIDDRDYEVQETEVTQKLYKAIMGENPSVIKKDNFPVENVSWFDAIVFCNRLSMVFGYEPVYSLDGNNDCYTWNYTPHKGQKINGQFLENTKANGFRLPTQGEFGHASGGGDNFYFSGSNSFEEVAWYTNDQHEVAKKMPNGFGLYDMAGNVNEWFWTSRGNDRCYSDYSINRRYYVSPENRFSTVGFRVFKKK